MIAKIRNWKDMERWDWVLRSEIISSSRTLETATIGELLNPRREIVDRSKVNFADLVPISIHFDGSISKRELKPGREFTLPMLWVKPGDVVLSKIDLKNGAVSILPAGWDNAAVTTHFAVYRPDKNKLDPRFFQLLIQSPAFKDWLRSNKTGHDGRTEVKLSDFEELEIPMPILSEQKALLDAYEMARKTADVLEADAKRAERRAIQEFEAALGLTPPPDLPRRLLQIARFKALDRWSHEAILHQALIGDEPPETHYEIVSLEDIAQVSYGIQKCPTNRPGAHARPYLRVANVRRGRLDLREIKYINVSDAEMPRLRLAVNDILFVEGNGSKLELGRAAMWNGEIDDCVHQNHIIKARPDCRRVDPEFLMEWFNTDAGRQHFFRNAKTTSGLGTLNSTDIRTAPVPLPPSVEEQQKIVKKLRDARRHAEAIRQEAGRISAAAWTDFLNAVFH